jgi:hypothetical protein
VSRIRTTEQRGARHVAGERTDRLADKESAESEDGRKPIRVIEYLAPVAPTAPLFEIAAAHDGQPAEDWLRLLKAAFAGNRVNGRRMNGRMNERMNVRERTATA